VYLWGDVGVRTIFDKIHDNKTPPNPIIPMELVRVSKENLGDWARQLKAWGFTDVDPKYLALPAASGAAAPAPGAPATAAPAAGQ
jgi:ribose transport system substrate-binding protein